MTRRAILDYVKGLPLTQYLAALRLFMPIAGLTKRVRKLLVLHRIGKRQSPSLANWSDQFICDFCSNCKKCIESLPDYAL